MCAGHSIAIAVLVATSTNNALAFTAGVRVQVTLAKLLNVQNSGTDAAPPAKKPAQA